MDKRLDGKELAGHIIGISVGSSNLPQVNTLNKAIDDYVTTFNFFKNKTYVKYFELNISCPNTVVTESFATIKNFESLIRSVNELRIKQPIFVKMPNEIELADCDALVKKGLRHSMRGYIFSNLVKDRQNKYFDKSEIDRVSNLKGNFSGKPTFENSNRLIAYARKTFGNDIAIIGCGGVFNAADAVVKINCGADLVQLVTGMVFEGPQIAGDINRRLTESEE